MTVAVYLPSAEKTLWWCQTLGDLMPGWTVEPLDAVKDPSAVTFAVVWRPRTGDLAKLPNLKAIVSIGAGVDHVLADSELPAGIPIIRTIGDDLTQRMKEYVALNVLRHHRDMPALQASQAQHAWKPVIVPPATQRRVGVMGLGNLGAEAAKLLSAIGFQTVGWSRSQKDVPGVTCYSGADGFDAFLEGTEILVCLLPLTALTKGILNADTFAKLKPGASVVNAARGPHLVDDDLLAALDSGQIYSATLDVFHIEPLPSDHPFWAHPQITVTPHIASLIDAPTGGKIIARNIQAFDAAGTLPDLADASRGY